MDLQVLPIDLTAIIVVVLGGLAILLPVAGLTLRYALKPIVEALSLYREQRVEQDHLEMMEQRLALVERQLEGVAHNLDRLVEKDEFDRELGAGDS